MHLTACDFCRRPEIEGGEVEYKQTNFSLPPLSLSHSTASRRALSIENPCTIEHDLTSARVDPSISFPPLNQKSSSSTNLSTTTTLFAAGCTARRRWKGQEGRGVLSSVLVSLFSALERSPPAHSLWDPVSNAGGGGERVLWTALAYMQRTSIENVYVIYTGDRGVSKESMIEKVQVSARSLQLSPLAKLNGTLSLSIESIRDHS